MVKAKTVTRVIFYVVVLSIACLLTFLQYQKYMKNEDVSSISYRRFNIERRDVYPSFSICLYSSFGMIFKQNENILGLKGWKGGNLYRRMLLGEESVKDDFIRKRRFRLVDFDHLTVNLLDDIVLVFHAVTKNGNFVHEVESKNKNELRPFVYGYQDPNQICITRKRTFTKQSLLNYEVLKLDVKLLYNITADLHVYIHKPGELTRMLHKPTASFSLNDFKEMTQTPPLNNLYHFNVNHVEVMRTRPDGIAPCNDTSVDDDVMYRTVIAKSAGCIPSYWKRFFLSSSKMIIENWPDCVHQSQFRLISQMFLPDLNVPNATKLYLTPCDTMKSIISTTRTSVSETQKLVLQFDYISEEYKVFQNT